MSDSTARAASLTLPGLISGLARRFPDRLALVGDKLALSFADLDRRSARVAAGLERIGIVRGDCVAVWLPNLPEWIELFLACSRLGAITLALNTRFRSREVGDILRRSGSKVLVFWPTYKAGEFAEVLNQIDASHLSQVRTTVIYGDALPSDQLPAALAHGTACTYSSLSSHGSHSGVAGSVDDGCLIYTTSGTSSLPKFALHSHRSLVQHACDLANAPGSYALPDSAGLNLMPLCGAFGMTQTLGAIAGGATTFLPRAFDPQQAAQIIRKHRITNMAGIDEVFFRLLEVVQDTPAFPSIRCVAAGSFNGSSEDFLRVADARGLHGINAYGMSEFQGLFSLQPVESDRQRRATGGGIPVSSHAQVRVRDPDTGELLPHDTPGELEVKAPSVMLGYYGDASATKAAMMEDGFFRTGDLGTTTPDGGLTFISRIGDTLRLSGFLVNSVEISRHIEEHPTIAECQVVGAHSPDGFRPVAFVMLKEGAALDEHSLSEFCRQALAKYKLPSRFIALDEFPATDGPNGRKIQRHILRNMAEDLFRQPSTLVGPTVRSADDTAATKIVGNPLLELK